MFLPGVGINADSGAQNDRKLDCFGCGGMACPQHIPERSGFYGEWVSAKPVRTESDLGSMQFELSVEKCTIAKALIDTSLYALSEP